MSRARVTRLRALRRHLAEAGLTVGAPQSVAGRDVVEVGDFLAEAEVFVPHVKPPPTWEAYRWMYRSMGELHRALASAPLRVPRPVVSTYGPPSSLRRLLTRTTEAVAENAEAADLVKWLSGITRKLEAQWVHASQLPVQLVHGDIRLGNVCYTDGDQPVYLDFGFTASRPRVHDLAYSLSWIILRPDAQGQAENFEWDQLTGLLAAYEEGSGTRLSEIERRAVGPYLAAVPIYLAAVAGFTPDPTATLLGEVAFLQIAEWVLDHTTT